MPKGGPAGNLLHASDRSRYLGHPCVPEKIDIRRCDAETGNRCDQRASQKAKEAIAVTDNPIEFVQGSGNVFRDFGYPDADVRQAKALIGTQIMKILDAEGLSTRQAEARTGVSHSEFSRIRQAKFSRFTIDRLIAILSRFGQDVELSIKVHPRPQQAAAHEPGP